MTSKVRQQEQGLMSRTLAGVGRVAEILGVKDSYQTTSDGRHMAKTFEHRRNFDNQIVEARKM